MEIIHGLGSKAVCVKTNLYFFYIYLLWVNAAARLFCGCFIGSINLMTTEFYAMICIFYFLLSHH